MAFKMGRENKSGGRICKYLENGVLISINREIDIVEVAAWYKPSLW